MFRIGDDEVLTAFEEEELANPSPRKIVDGERAIYLSRELQIPNNWGGPVLCDFGSAVVGQVEHTEDVQPDIYRAPEVILESPWSYQIDIWNTGCMIWNIFEGGGLFTGQDPEHQTYRSRAHLAEMIALLGKPPQELLDSGKASQRFFTDNGEFRDEIPLPDSRSLGERENNTELDAESRKKFLAFMQKMLQWEPLKRSSAKALAEDEWIKENNR